MPDKPVKPMNNQAYEYLFDKIVYCQYLPGQELNEKALIDETGFGRTPLREALLLLQKTGLVDIFPRKGMRVSRLTEKSVHDLYQTRKLIEPGVAMEYKTWYSKGVLLNYQQQFSQAAALEPPERFRLDIGFHSYLISVTDNKILMDMYSSLMVSQIRLAMCNLLIGGTDTLEEEQEQHAGIIDALLRENEKDIRDAVIYHLNRSMIRSLNTVRATAQ